MFCIPSLTELCSVQEFHEKKNEKKKSSKGDNLEIIYRRNNHSAGDTLPLTNTQFISFHFDSIKAHEDIPNNYRVIGCTRKNIKQNRTINNNQRAIILKLKNGEQP